MIVGLLGLGLAAGPAMAQDGPASELAGAGDDTQATTPPSHSESAASESGDSESADAESTGAEPTDRPATDRPATDDEFGDQDETAAPGGEPSAIATTPEGERMRMIVIDAATFGIDPVVGRVASAEMRRVSEAAGYQTLSPADSVAAAQRLQMPYPPTPADLWRVSWVARSHRGAFARIWAHAGQYVIEISVASLDGAGPFFARGTAGASDLREVVAALFEQALPSAASWDSAAAARAGSDEPQTTAEPATDLNEFDDLDRPAPATPREPEPELRRWSLTLQTEAAIGADDVVFYNHLTGVRLDFRITRDLALGAYAAWVNLNGRDGRVDNLLVMLQFESRIRLSSGLDLTIPLRAAVGYLPFNGPVVRLSAGVNYAFDEHFEMGVDLLTPTFWFLPNGAAVSLDLALEATYRF